MKKTVGVIFLLAVFIGMAVVPGMAAIIVHDPQNTAENHATYLQAAQNTLNTSTQIANQVINLTGVSTETMLTYILGIEKDFTDLSETMKQSQGLMKATQTAEKAWDSAFKQIDTFFDGKTSSMDNLADSQKMIYALDRTYKDSLRIAKTTEDIEKDAKRLRELMEQNQNAVGNKQAVQTQNNLLAQQNLLTIKQNQTLGAMASALVAHYAKQNQAEAFATAVNQAYVAECEKIIAENIASKKRLGIE